MAPTRRRLLVTGAALSLAGCIGDDPGQDDSTPTPTETPTATEPPAASPDGTDTSTDTTGSSTTIRTRVHEEHGSILVGPDGLTLYMFDQDTRGADTSACAGGCAETWPPLNAPHGVEGGAGVTAELDTFERADGTRQATANGWPLYYYAGDDEPGDATGQGVGGVWWVLDADGSPLAATPTATATATRTDTDGSDGGGNYGY